MTDWAQVWTQIIVTPIAAAIVGAVSAGIVVSRQSLAHDRINARLELGAILSRFRFEADAWRYMRSYASWESAEEVFYESYLQCVDALKVARRLGWAERMAIRKFCKRYFGAKIVRVATKIPTMNDNEAFPFENIQYSAADGLGNSLDTTYRKGLLHTQAFRRDFSDLFPSENEKGVALDKRNRGAGNLFRMTAVAELFLDDEIKDVAADRIVKLTNAIHPISGWKVVRPSLSFPIVPRVK